MNKIGWLLLNSISMIFASSWQSFDAKKVAALPDNQLLLIKVMRNNCAYCSYMENRVFSDKKVSDLLAANFSLIKVNASHESLPFGLKGTMVPSFYVINKKAEVFKHIRGAFTKEDFIDLIAPYMKEKR